MVQDLRSDTGFADTHPSDLLDRFESDIRYDAHSTRAKVSRSKAGKEIRCRGGELVPLVRERVATLKAAAKTAVDEEVVEGFKLLLDWAS